MCNEFMLNQGRIGFTPDDRIFWTNCCLSHVVFAVVFGLGVDGVVLGQIHSDPIPDLGVLTREHLVIRGHVGSIHAVAFSPNGQLIASAGVDRTVRVWDAKTGRQTLKIDSTSPGVFFSLAFSRDGKTLVTAHGSGLVQTFDVADGRLKRTLKGHTNVVRSVAVSPDGKTFASGCQDGFIRLWDIESGQLQTTLEDQPRGEVHGVAFSPDGKLVASGGSGPGPTDSTVKIWQVSPVKKLREFPDGGSSVAFSRDGKLVAAASYDGIRLKDVTSGKNIATIDGHAGSELSVAFSPGGETFAATVNDDIFIWNLKTGRRNATLRGHKEDWVNSIAFAPDGKTLCSAGEDGTIQLWNALGNPPEPPARPTLVIEKVSDAAIKHERFRLPGGDWTMQHVAYSPDGKRLAFAVHGRSRADLVEDGAVILWDVGGRRELVRWPRSEPVRFEKPTAEILGIVHSIAFSPDSKRVAIGTDQGVKIWPIAINSRAHTLYGYEKQPHGDRLSGDVDSVSFSPAGQRLVVGGLGFIDVWNVSNGELIRTIEAGGKAVVTFSPDGTLIASAEGHNRVHLWDAASGRQLAEDHAQLGPLYGIVFLRKGASMAAVGEGGLALWDVARPKKGTASLSHRERLKQHESSVYKITASPNGKWLATSSADRTVKLWDPQTRRELVTLRTGNKRSDQPLAFSPDSSHLLTTGQSSGKGATSPNVTVWKVEDLFP